MAAHKESSSYDLVIIGSGSAAFAAAIRASELGKRAAMVERAVLGGTCVNVGCIPSKVLIRAAEAFHRAGQPRFPGIDVQPPRLDFKVLIQEKDALVSELRRRKYQDVLAGLAGVELVTGEAVFEADHLLRVGERLLEGGRILIATGGSPWVPPLPGLSEAGYLTSTEALALKSLPASLAVLGGRAVALELAQMFQRLGVRVTVLQRSERILPREDPDLTQALTGCLEEEGLRIHTGVRLQRVRREQDRKLVDFLVGGDARQLAVEQILVATGRRPNSTGLGLEKIGVAVGRNGEVKTDAFCRTSVPHIYAAGDVAGPPAYVYTAAYEGRLAVENAFGEEAVPKDYAPLPFVIFTDPQVARVGLNEQMAGELGVEVESVRLELNDLPWALAARDTRGFVRLFRKKGGQTLVGASILAPAGGELLMEISLAIRYQIPVNELAGTLHPYLTLGEAVKLAAQSFGRDIHKLSCCAS